jgi:hypothetical protein
MTTKKLLVVAALACGACGGGSITVGTHTLNVASGQYLTNPAGYFCNGLHSGQIKVQLVDYSPVCKRDQKPGEDPFDPTIEHVEMDFVLSTGGVPDFLMKGFTVNPNTTCDGGGGPAYVVFTHLPAGAPAPDSTQIANGGTVRVTQYDPQAFKPLNATYDLTFPNVMGRVSGSFSVKNCD